MIILAIDPGTSCGWAVGAGPRPDQAGRVNLAPRTGESPGMRYIKLRGFLNDIRHAYALLGLVVMERAHHRGGAATAYAHGYQAIVEAWCAEQNIEHTWIHTATLKVHGTGKGNASKEAMIAAGRRAWGLAGDVTDDEVDARWLYDLARLQFGTGLIPERRTRRCHD